MKTKLLLVGALGVVAIAATGCLDILGYKERTLDAAGGGGAGGSTETGGSTAGGGGGAGATGGMGGALVCVPGDTQPCYSGPDGTKDMGVCEAGAQTCNDQGTGFGACVGEVTPAVEDCSKPGNEACTGALGCSDPIFVEQFGDESSQVIEAIRRSRNSEEYFIAGEFNGALKLGEKTLVSSDFSDLFLAKLGPAGEPLWAIAFSGQDGQVIGGIDTTPDGGVVLIGRSAKPVDFGGGPVNGLFTVKLDSNGGHVWTKACVANTFQTVPVGVVADSKGDVLLLANSTGSVDCGGGSASTAGAQDVFLYKLSGVGGGLVWSRQFGDSANQRATALAVDQGDNVFVAGGFSGTMELGVGDLSDTGGGDAFLIKRKSDGTESWAWQFGDPVGDQAILTLAVDSLAGPVFAGRFESSITIGNTALTSNGGVDMFVGALASGGQAKWAIQAGDLGSPDTTLRIGVDSENNVFLAGNYQGVVDFGGGLLDSGAGSDTFVSKLNPDGGHSWSKRWFASGDTYVGGVAWSGAGAMLVAGAFSGGVNLGPTFQLVSAGAEDGIVAAFAP